LDPLGDTIFFISELKISKYSIKVSSKIANRGVNGHMGRVGFGESFMVNF
jgi:hypothetical protein